MTWSIFFSPNPRSPSKDSGVKREDVADVADPVGVEQRDRGLVAEPVDVERAAAGEVEHRLAPLRRAADGVRAAPVDLALRRGRAGCRTPGTASASGTASPRRCASATTGPTTSGMTSPARRTTTVSPISTPLRLTSSSLCSVAVLTVTPPTCTGSSEANGVTRPVRPTLTKMLAQDRGDFLGRVFPRDRPPRRLRRRAEPALQRELVDLDDHAVDVVLDVVAMLTPVGDVRRALRPGRRPPGSAPLTGRPIACSAA